MSYEPEKDAMLVGLQKIEDAKLDSWETVFAQIYLGFRESEKKRKLVGGKSIIDMTDEEIINAARLKNGRITD